MLASVVAFVGIIVGLYLISLGLSHNVSDDTNTVRSARSGLDVIKEELELCIEPVFQGDWIKTFLELQKRLERQKSEEERRQRRRDIINALSWAGGSILLIAGIIFLLVAILTNLGMPRIIMPIITLLSVGTSLIITRVYHDQLPNLTAKLGFFAGIAVLPPTLVGFIFY